MRWTSGGFAPLVSHQDSQKRYYDKVLGKTTNMRYGSWDTEWGKDFFIILGHFLPFYLPNNPENKNIEKMKKASGEVIILHM